MSICACLHTCPTLASFVCLALRWLRPTSEQRSCSLSCVLSAPSSLAHALLLRYQFAGFATVIGGIIVVVFNPKKLSTLGVVLSFASGVMIYISFMDMMPEAQMVIGFGTANIYVRFPSSEQSPSKLSLKLLPSPIMPANLSSNHFMLQSI